MAEEQTIYTLQGLHEEVGEIIRLGVGGNAEPAHPDSSASFKNVVGTMRGKNQEVVLKNVPTATDGVIDLKVHGTPVMGATFSNAPSGRFRKGDKILVGSRYVQHMESGVIVRRIDEDITLPAGCVVETRVESASGSPCEVIRLPVKVSNDKRVWHDEHVAPEASSEDSSMLKNPVEKFVEIAFENVLIRSAGDGQVVELSGLRELVGEIVSMPLVSSAHLPSCSAFCINIQALLFQRNDVVRAEGDKIVHAASTFTVARKDEPGPLLRNGAEVIMDGPMLIHAESRLQIATANGLFRKCAPLAGLPP